MPPTTHSNRGGVSIQPTLRGHGSRVVDNLDGVSEALAPVFALPTTLRIKQLGTALGDVRQILAASSFRGSSIAGEIREAIEHFEVPAISGELATG